MFKIAACDTVSSLKEAKGILQRIYSESPDYWPYGLSVDGFDDGLYLVREKRSSTPVGFVGFQKRFEMDGNTPVKVGYYSIGVLPEYRRNGYAREAVSKIIAIKSAGVDRVRALIMQHNKPSLGLAKALNVEVRVKKASLNATRSDREPKQASSQGSLSDRLALGLQQTAGGLRAGLDKAWNTSEPYLASLKDVLTEAEHSRPAQTLRQQLLAYLQSKPAYRDFVKLRQESPAMHLDYWQQKLGI